MRRIIVYVMAMMTALSMPLIAEAQPNFANSALRTQAAEHNGIDQVRRGGGGFRGGGFRGGRHFRGGGRHWNGGRAWRGGRYWRGGRAWRGGRYWRGGRWYGGRGRYWGGRWWAYGVGTCWRWSPYYGRFVWVCY
ncbi:MULTISPECIES: hypothetical protein [unclassified Hyphomicrobium]|uniref:hypothetical protein n=1 Tax=unclassified Hyphomicrobium TaxID=2619925 RepID=UPI0012DC3722|nr:MULTISPECIES: hypothetical protein [unclassified Hyphomicrobium]